MSRNGGRLLTDLSLLAAALALLIIGVHANSDVGTTLGVIGYALLVLSVHATHAVLRQWRHHP